MLYIHGSIIEKGLDKHFHSTAAAAAAADIGWVYIV